MAPPTKKLVTDADVLRHMLASTAAAVPTRPRPPSPSHHPQLSNNNMLTSQERMLSNTHAAAALFLNRVPYYPAGTSGHPSSLILPGGRAAFCGSAAGFNREDPFLVATAAAAAAQEKRKLEQMVFAEYLNTRTYAVCSNNRSALTLVPYNTRYPTCMAGATTSVQGVPPSLLAAVPAAASIGAPRNACVLLHQQDSPATASMKTPVDHAKSDRGLLSRPKKKAKKSHKPCAPSVKELFSDIKGKQRNKKKNTCGGNFPMPSMVSFEKAKETSIPPELTIEYKSSIDAQKRWVQFVANIPENDESLLSQEQTRELVKDLFSRQYWKRRDGGLLCLRGKDESLEKHNHHRDIAIKI